MGECGPEVVWITSHRIAAVTTRQMFRDESPDGSFADRAQGMALGCQPMSEVRDATKVNTPGSPGIPSTMEMIAVGGDIAPKNAVLRPCTLLRLDDDLFAH